METKHVYCIVDINTKAAPFRECPNVAIRAVAITGYELGIDVHGQRKEWRTEKAAERALEAIRNMNPTGTKCLAVFARYVND